ncbi:tropomyosin 1 alpha, putative [Babesia ovata]|uniref:Tropomyosin 1 alpha, putative n=1 Tax=Babesia ovata TaxID=189622 RepID=A0A2H6KHV4_9APIC|nr:tropomyosin 1 alpha, putative [Babesia ovata]GBE62570.1 tropomyosin 1 alpha, putative [Babesia ovata]
MRGIWPLVVSTAIAIANRGNAEKPDLQKLENEQKLLIHDLQRSRLASEELKDKLDILQQSKNASSSTLNVSNVVVEKDEKPKEEHSGSVNYTAPIIVLLPEEPSEREKWEYNLTLRCLGQRDFSPFEGIHNSKLLEMATIKGKTVAEIRLEIKHTEKELSQVEARKELEGLQSALSSAKEGTYAERTQKLHVSHNIKLVKHEIDVLETKLHRLQKRLKAAVLFSSGTGKHGSSKKQGHEDADEGEASEDREEQDAEDEAGEQEEADEADGNDDDYEE